MERLNIEPNTPNDFENDSWVPPTSEEQRNRQEDLIPQNSFGEKTARTASIKIPLSGEFSDKVPGVQSNQDYATSSADFANRANAQFSKWKDQIASFDEPKLFKFVAFCNNQIKTNPFIPEHPELIQMYRKVQALAVSRLGDKIINPISKKIIEFKTLINRPETKPKFKSLALEIDDDLKLLENSYEIRQKDPDIARDEEKQIAVLQGQIMPLRESFEKLKNSIK